MTDWFPSKEAGVVDLCKKWGNTLDDDEKIAAWGWNAEACAVLLGLISVFLDARSAYHEDDSTAKSKAKAEAKKVVSKAMRKFANRFIRFNDLMTESERSFFGIRARDTTPTVHARPKSQPTTTVMNTVNHYEHLVKAFSHLNDKGTRPADAHGVRFAWQVGGERPKSGEALPRSKFSRKITMVIAHTEEDKGNRVYYATCYENARGEMGPWSPVTEAFIG